MLLYPAHRAASRLVSAVVQVSILCLSVVAGCALADGQGIDYSNHDIRSLQESMERGSLTSRQLTEFYLQRIATLDRDGPQLNSIIEVNPQAVEIAIALDEERKSSGMRGPLHGIPVVLKANIDTSDRMATTAGSLALAGHRPPRDAFLVTRLREAGAVILAKSNLTEWANFRSSRSLGGWSSLGGQTRNPYALNRSPCGSSSGSAVAVAAGLTAAAVGTETNGSIVCPASVTGIVGVKPTVGLVSRSGIIPIAHSQDTAGSLSRTVMDGAILMSAMLGADSQDLPTLVRAIPVSDFTRHLSLDALEGTRVGVFRSHRGAGKDERIDAIVEQGIRTLRSLGAEVVDPVEISTDGLSEAESEVLFYEFKAGLNKYLEETGAALATLEQIIEFNENHSETVMRHFGQDRMLAAQKKGPLEEQSYLRALETSKKISRDGIDGAMRAHNLDVLIAPTRGPAWIVDAVLRDTPLGISSSRLAAIAGYPSITVPAGEIEGLPVGLSFIGAAYSDASLFGYAYAFEQAGYVRRLPDLREFE